jgi:FkbM family methyltransferase
MKISQISRFSQFRYRLSVLAVASVILFAFYYRLDKLATQVIDLELETKRWVYIDLGVNNGDSVYSFFTGRAKYPSLLTQADIQDNTWIVHAFEANPRFNDQLDRMKKEIENGGRREINLYKSTAAWIYNGNISFYVETKNAKHSYWASSIKSDMVEEKEKEQVTVPCVDIAGLLSQFTDEDMVVMKVDIEGAEFELLTHLIARNALRVVDIIGVEYHHHGASNDTQDQKRILNNTINQMGIKQIEWV